MEKKEKKIQTEEYCGDTCPVRKTLKLLGGKWTLLILFEIGEEVLRYGEIKRKVIGISEKMLIQELNYLVKHKLVHKKAYPEIPPRVEYKLTDFGLKTLPIAQTLGEFGLENLYKKT